MPTSNPLSQLFGRSPFGPLQDHIERTYACAEQLIPFFAATIANDWDEAQKIRDQISQLEHEADELKREIRISLPNSLFTAVPRSELLQLVSLQDKIANRAKDIAGLMLGRKMGIPKTMAEAMLAYVRSGVLAVDQARQAITELDELIESGFGRQVSDLLNRMIQQLDKLEHDADRLQVSIRAQLFQLEKDMYPVDVMFLYKIIDWTGDLSDRAQSVGGRLQIILAR
ncbi:TIGR00153 family protein [Terasakiispira papahanaumokuakeensis]|uniref:TIGR00153 family protein n=1 Tax=Terasakiispira papahanaumokuakeensis TaxID=197479 RepID=A0A1E2V5S5_9GAMM|nr:TIGR00153 family protein [Terasakiispira papahanaumokuakeensis]ODC02360.1 TIGR00153 family protein [Terasakiispira papahanaumokuakeensis]